MEPSVRAVLVVEDELPVLEILEDCLREAGYTVVAASDTDTALALARSTPLSAAIVDLQLPGGSGRDVVAAIPDATPVIIVSGLPEESADLETTRPGTVLVPKPYSTSLLIELLGETIAETTADGHRRARD